MNPHTPDFSNAKVGDKCFSVGNGDAEIKSIELNWLDLIETTENEFHNQYNCDGRLYKDDIHPTLFNSFQQFLDYWAWEKENGGSNETPT